jgi:hypothetical protein
MTIGHFVLWVLLFPMTDADRRRAKLLCDQLCAIEADAEGTKAVPEALHNAIVRFAHEHGDENIVALLADVPFADEIDELDA